VLTHVNPDFRQEQLCEVRRLKSANTAQKLVQAQQRAACNDAATQASRGIPPIIIRLCDSSLVQTILKNGNKKMKSYTNTNIKLVDDIL
jgi:hypothetical protein